VFLASEGFNCSDGLWLKQEAQLMLTNTLGGFAFQVKYIKIIIIIKSVTDEIWTQASYTQSKLCAALSHVNTSFHRPMYHIKYIFVNIVYRSYRILFIAVSIKNIVDISGNKQFVITRACMSFYQMVEQVLRFRHNTGCDSHPAMHPATLPYNKYALCIRSASRSKK